MANNSSHSAQGNQFLKACYLYEETVHMVTGFSSEIYYINYVIGLTFNIVLTILTISLNSITIVAYRKSSKLRSKKSFFFIMLLSICDVLVGHFGNTSYVLLLITTIIGYPRCPIYFLYEFSSFFTCSMSFVTLFCMNIERYLSILHPFYHLSKVTKSKLLKLILALWLFMITLRLSYLAFANITSVIVSVTIVVISSTTVYIYIAIWMKVRRRSRTREPREMETREATARVIEERTRQTNEQQNIKMAKSCAVVVALTYVCYIPFAVIFAFPKSNIVILLSLWTTTLGLSPSSLNSLVFFWNNPILRTEANKLFENIF